MTQVNMFMTMTMFNMFIMAQVNMFVVILFTFCSDASSLGS